MGMSSFDQVLDWVGKQQAGLPIVPSLAAHDLSGQVDAVEIAKAMAQMSQKGILRRVFAVRTPSGTILRKTYPSASKIDPVVFDQFNREIREDDLEVVPAFERVKK